MEWECTECGRTYSDPPDPCPVCGGSAVVPEGSRSPGGPLDRAAARVWGVVFDPDSVSRPLTAVTPAVELAFRLLAVLAGVLVVLGVAALVL